ncbi:hypothetical protein Egran_02713 [Elaphomyces granulatus]|uniref:Uncharacterized protein n=1 Tax=Elaphomyces granulatus TaxID=519963 RepID=A0A232LZH1_9EURO|nr:hypothetical protein Egran_02713 [Elaphomyces granulatus]
MSPPKPILHPLQTPKSATFPSELHKSSESLPSEVKREDASSTPITPPVAYTEFLKALTPIFTSPASPGASFPRFPGEKSTSQPSTATSGTFPSEAFRPLSATFPPQSPSVPPSSAKRLSLRNPLRLSPVLSYSPTGESPKTASTIRSPFSPSDWKTRFFDAPRSAQPMSVRQVVTRTVTFKRTPLDPPPKGKRRKTNES